jgi:hypothetical protein
MSKYGCAMETIFIYRMWATECAVLDFVLVSCFEAGSLNGPLKPQKLSETIQHQLFIRCIKQ